MKKTFLIFISVLIVIALAACSNSNSPGGSSKPPATTTAATKTPQASADTETSQDLSYSFEFEDIDGNTHKLSDYEGMPVYLEVWGSWCSVCVSALPEMEEFAGQDHDFAVLSVVTPNVSGEKSKEDFIEWYKDLGYENLIVLIDEDAQIVRNFGVRAYPSQLMFDAKGNFVTGFPGLISKEMIVDIMGQIAEGTYTG